MDIYENSSVLDPQLAFESDVVKGLLDDQHKNIEKIFVNFLSDAGKKEFGWQPRT